MNSGRSWDSTTVEDEGSPEKNTEQVLSDDNHSSELQYEHEGDNRQFIRKVLIVFLIIVIACSLLYGMTQFETIDSSNELKVPFIKNRCNTNELDCPSDKSPSE